MTQERAALTQDEESQFEFAEIHLQANTHTHNILSYLHFPPLRSHLVQVSITSPDFIRG